MASGGAECSGQQGAESGLWRGGASIIDPETAVDLPLTPPGNVGTSIVKVQSEAASHVLDIVMSKVHL